MVRCLVQTLELILLMNCREKCFNNYLNRWSFITQNAISTLTAITGGVVVGDLVGGNLSLLARGIGTKFEIDTKGKLLLLEDIGEEPARVDGLLNQLRMSGKLADAAGIVLGDFSKTETKKQWSLTLDEVFDHYFSNFDKAGSKRI